MLVIPAIDLRHGRCVRLRQGRYEEEAVYFDDPVRMAKLWRVMNAKVLHVRDVDAAPPADGGPPAAPPLPYAEAGENREVLAELVRALDIPVEVDAGARTMADVEGLLGLGVYRVILGPHPDPAVVAAAVARFGAGRIVVGLDAGAGAEGAAAAGDLAAAMERCGVRRFVCAAVARDGDEEAPDVEAYRTVAARLSRARITAAGGVSAYRDLLALAALAPTVDSVVVGRALYENRFPCQQFWCWHRKEGVDLDRFSTAPLA